jgi:hypothetical protein
LTSEGCLLDCISFSSSSLAFKKAIKSSCMLSCFGGSTGA